MPLLSEDATGEALDYAKYSEALEGLRTKYQEQGLEIHITGFTKVMGDLIEGVQAVLWFFALAVVIATIMVFWYTRCVRSTFL